MCQNSYLFGGEVTCNIHILAHGYQARLLVFSFPMPLCPKGTQHQRLQGQQLGSKPYPSLEHQASVGPDRSPGTEDVTQQGNDLTSQVSKI